MIIIIHASIKFRTNFGTTSKTPFQWRFVGGPLLASIHILAGMMMGMMIFIVKTYINTLFSPERVFTEQYPKRIDVILHSSIKFLQ